MSFGENIGNVNSEVRTSLENYLGEVLNPQIPKSFLEDLNKTRIFIQKLDEDPFTAIKDEGIRTFIGQISNTGFITDIKFQVKMWGDQNLLKALPYWLQDNFLQENRLKKDNPVVNKDSEEKIKKDFDKLTSGLKSEKRVNGEYFQLNSQNPSKKDARKFKLYIEDTSLLQGLKTGDISSTLKSLISLGINPDQFKLFEGTRLVFYFDTDISRFEEIGNIFKEYNVSYRGPAQDAFAYELDNGNIIQSNDTLSNDSALGENTYNPYHEYRLKIYESRAFLENYARLCLFAGKSPSEPYKSSFVYLLAGTDTTSNLYLDKAEELSGYPAVYSQRRINFKLYEKELEKFTPELTDTKTMPDKSISRLQRLINWIVNK